MCRRRYVKMDKIFLTDYLGQNSLHEGCPVNTMKKKHLINVNKSGSSFFFYEGCAVDVL